MSINENVYMVFHSAESKKQILEKHDDNDVYKIFDVIINEKCVYPNKWYTSCEDLKNFMKSIVKSILLRNISTYFIYDPLMIKENISIDILSLTVKYLFQKYYLYDYEYKGMLYVHELKNPKNFTDDGLYCCVVGLDGGFYHDLLQSKRQQHKQFTLTDFVAVHVDSSLKFISTIEKKIFESSRADCQFNFKHCQMYIYILIYVRKNSHDELKLSTLNIIGVKSLNNFINDCGSLGTSDEKQLEMIYSKMKMNLKEISSSITENKFAAFVNIRNKDDIIQSRHLFKFIAETTEHMCSTTEDFQDCDDSVYLKQKLIRFQNKIKQLQIAHKKEIENIDRNNQIEIANKTKKLNQISEQLQEDIQATYHDKIENLRKYYENKFKTLQEQSEHQDDKENVTPQRKIVLNKENNKLIQQKGDLKEEGASKNIILPKIKDEREENVNSKLEKYADLKKQVGDCQQFDKIIEKKNCLIEEFQVKLGEQNEIITKLKDDMKNEKSINEQLQRELFLKQHTLSEYKVELDKKEENVQKLEIDLLKFQEDLEKMRSTNVEIYQKYEKLLQKKDQECAIHKREAESVVRQIVYRNLTPSPIKPKLPTHLSEWKPKTAEENKTPGSSRILRSGKKLEQQNKCVQNK